MAGEFEQVYGGPPYGKSLSRMAKAVACVSYGQNRNTASHSNFGAKSVLLDWHWFSGLSRLGKPVEMIYIPEGTHILEKPWDRMISQQGNVDWFCFWLKGEEDPDPTKAEQYKRWRELRSLRRSNGFHRQYSMTNQARGRVFLLVEIIGGEDAPVNGFDDSPMTLDVRAADHFRYAAQNVMFGLQYAIVLFIVCFLHFGFTRGLASPLICRDFRQTRV